MKEYTSSIVNVSLESVATITSFQNGSGIKWCPVEGKEDPQYKQFYTVAQIITGLFIYPMSIFPGLVGNALTIFVLSRRNMRTSTNAFLSALAVSDSCKLINDMLYFFVTLFLRTSSDLGNLAYGYLYPYAHFVFSLSVCVSSWLTVSVAVERYILVCHPTRARALWNRKRAVMLCVVIYVIMTSLAFPSALRYRTIRCIDSSTNMSRLEVELTEMWQDKVLITAYDWAQNLIRSIIPLIVLVVLNACIIAALRRTKAKKRKNSRHRVTIMMLVVIIVFLVCITPDAILSTVFGFGYHEAGYLEKGIREITDSLLTINAGINFLIYCAFNQVFRKSFARLCFPKKRQTKWTTELDESTYRRLSEAKSLLSSNNNSSPRQDTSSTLFADSSLCRRINSYEASGKCCNLSDTVSKSDGGCKDSDQIRQSTSSLTSFSTSSDSHPNHLPHHPQHRLSCAGLKKSRNSVKSNRAKNKGSVTFSDTTHVRNRSTLEDTSSSDSHSRDSTTAWTHVPSIQKVRRNNSSLFAESLPPVQSDNSSNDTDEMKSNVGQTGDTCDAQKLANFRICDGSKIIASSAHDPKNVIKHIDGNNYSMCRTESVKPKKRKCYLSVLFIDNAVKSEGPETSQTQNVCDITDFRGETNGHETTTTFNPNKDCINEDDITQADYLHNSCFHGFILTTDV